MAALPLPFLGYPGAWCRGQESNLLLGRGFVSLHLSFSLRLRAASPGLNREGAF